MTDDTHLMWADANQAYLTEALAEVRKALERYTERGADSPVAPPSEDEHVLGTSEAGAETALETVSRTFGLSPFERAVLLLCAGMELDSRFADCCARAQGDPRRAAPTFALALAALPDAHWSALAPEAPLRRWRLIEAGPGERLVSRPLAIDERVLHYLAGAPQYVDDRLRGFVDPISFGGLEELADSHVELAREVAGRWSRDAGIESRPVLHLVGVDPHTNRGVAAAACAHLGLQLHALRAEDIPAAPAEREALARLWEREAVLSESALLIDLENAPDETCFRAQAFVRHVYGLFFITSRDGKPWPGWRVVRFDVERPSGPEQEALWRRALGPAAERLNGEVEAVVAQFNLGPRAIRTVSADLLNASAGPSGEVVSGRLWQACRAQARVGLDGLAQRIVPGASRDDLVLPEAQHEMLREIALHLRHRTTVYDRWGFRAKSGRGLGIAALFAGPSGTGKTLAAEVVANELELDLYRIDLSAVVSKYIGETEKNLRRVFDAAEECGAVLLFDEADALFGKRSEVKDSHDRHANVEISYLLQRMEEYRGLAVLTTNRKDDLDPAFLRRIRFVVQFPYPDAAQRAEIWAKMIPAGLACDGVDVARLARLNLTGGNIRSLALGAAFRAADAGEPLRMEHLARAARTEYAKLGKPFGADEVSISESEAAV